MDVVTVYEMEQTGRGADLGKKWRLPLWLLNSRFILVILQFCLWSTKKATHSFNFIHPLVMSGSFHVYTSLPTLVPVCITHLFYLATLVCVKWYLSMVLIHIFLLTNNAEHLFICQFITLQGFGSPGCGAGTWLYLGHAVDPFPSSLERNMVYQVWANA